jgi:hypothetical protein
MGLQKQMPLHRMIDYFINFATKVLEAFIEENAIISVVIVSKLPS